MLKSAAPSSSKINSINWHWVIVIAAVLFNIVIRIRLLQMPLERDEGEFGYMAQLILDGEAPYKYAYNMKLPGVYYAYAIFMMIFGETIEGIRTGLIIVNILTIILVFFLARELFNNFTGAIAAFSYAVFSVDPGVMGNAAHATQYVNAASIAGILLLLKAGKNNKSYCYFFSGLSLGLAFIMKQHALFFIPFAYLYIAYLYREKNPAGMPHVFQKIILLTTGIVVPYGLVCLIVTYHGVFDRFWFWTFKYSRSYTSIISFSDALKVFGFMFPFVVNKFALLWIIAGAGCMLLLIDKIAINKKVFMFLFTVCSFLCIVPGFLFRDHYFIVFLPALSICIGITFNFIRKRAGRFNISIVTLLLFFIYFSITGWGIAQQKDYFFYESPVKLSRKIYGVDPFPESIKISQFIKSRTDENDTIAVLGSEPQIYFYADRKSATGYIYTYGLMENHAYSLYMQQDMIKEIEASDPEFLVSVKIDTSWLVNPDSERLIFSWFSNYAQQNYNLVGIVDIISDNITVYKWDEDVKNYKTQSNSVIYIYEKK